MNISSIDLGIIIAYLVLTVVVGIYYGRGVKTFKDFAVGNQRFLFPVLTMTIFASEVDGFSTIGTVDQIYKVGILFFLAGFGYVLYQIFVVSRYIAPQIVRFQNSISLGDLIKTRFGIKGKIFSGISVSGVFCL